MIVTREQARIALYTRVEELQASYGPVDVEFSTAKAIDRSIQVEPFLKVTMKYMDGMQVELGPDAHTRAIGVIIVEALAKEGTGASTQNNILDHFYRALQKTDSMRPLRTHAARLASPGVVDGWSSEGAVIPFWYDTQ